MSQQQEKGKMSNREVCDSFLLINPYKMGLCWVCASSHLTPHPCPIQSLSREGPTLCMIIIIHVLASLVCCYCDACVSLMLTAFASWIIPGREPRLGCPYTWKTFPALQYSELITTTHKAQQRGAHPWPWSSGCRVGAEYTLFVVQKWVWWQMLRWWALLILPAQDPCSFPLGNSI